MQGAPYGAARDSASPGPLDERAAARSPAGSPAHSPRPAAATTGPISPGGAASPTASPRTGAPATAAPAEQQVPAPLENPAAVGLEVQLPRASFAWIGCFGGGCVVFVMSLVSCNRGGNSCSGYYAYGIVVGAAAAAICGMILAIVRKSFDDDAESDRTRAVLAIIAFCLLLWWIAGTAVLTFDHPFTVPGNGYFATWIGLACSLVLVLQHKLPSVFETHFELAVVGIVLFLASIVVMVAAAMEIHREHDEARMWILFCSTISVVVSGAIPWLYFAASAEECFIVRMVHAIFLLVWWLAGVVVATFNRPFKVAGNGYFGSWAAAAVSARLLSIVLLEMRPTEPPPAASPLLAGTEIASGGAGETQCLRSQGPRSLGAPASGLAAGSPRLEGRPDRGLMEHDAAGESTPHSVATTERGAGAAAAAAPPPAGDAVCGYEEHRAPQPPDAVDREQSPSTTVAAAAGSAAKSREAGDPDAPAGAAEHTASADAGGAHGPPPDGAPEPEAEAEPLPISQTLVVAWLMSLVELVAATWRCDSCTSYDAWAVAAGAIGFGISGITLLLLLAQAIGPCLLSASCVLLAVNWSVGVAILTFHEPFRVPGNGYFASWFALLSSWMLMNRRIPQLQAVRDALGREWGVIFFASAVLLVQGVVDCAEDSKCKGNNAWAVACPVISIAIVVVAAVLVYLDWMHSILHQWVAVTLALLWCATTLVVTFFDPYTTLGNGYFAAWVAFMASAMFVRRAMRLPETPRGGPEDGGPPALHGAGGEQPQVNGVCRSPPAVRHPLSVRSVGVGTSPLGADAAPRGLPAPPMPAEEVLTEPESVPPQHAGGVE
eukprot:TRINITY_DN18698_c0_g1_i1.p1 TRINITY_DN18698_c0_g1~~TRINITY_DN18698_c0_g1_i1.p1  ORF type:complete len:832 (+),score=159.31 TRINITY_DN18698_c0_g1_i1:101-2596(+)